MKITNLLQGASDALLESLDLVEDLACGLWSHCHDEDEGWEGETTGVQWREKEIRIAQSMFL